MKGHPLRHGWIDTRRTLAALPLALAFLVACGGGSKPPAPPPAPATRIAYEPPASGAYQLVLNAERTTATHLVLDLLGPTGTAGRGVAFRLMVEPTQLAWSKVSSGDTEFAGAGAFAFWNGSVLTTKVTSGTLQVGTFCIDPLQPSVTFGPTTVLTTVALDLVPGVPTGTATLRTPSASAVMLPAALGGDPVPITVAVGTVTLK